jgi:phage terminase large subunit-like protein
MKQVGIPTWKLFASEVAAACSLTHHLFATDKVRHNNDPLLIVQNPNGVVKYLGDRWFIARKESYGEVDALMATIFATYVSERAQHAQIGVF